jgi:hypothetical protein
MLPTLLLLRLLAVLGVTAALVGALVWGVDKIGDAREAKVRAEFAEAIDDVNAKTAADGEMATIVRLRDEGLRAKAVAEFKAALKPTTQCTLTVDEAANLKRVR